MGIYFDGGNFGKAVNFRNVNLINLYIHNRLTIATRKGDVASHL